MEMTLKKYILLTKFGWIIERDIDTCIRTTKNGSTDNKEVWVSFDIMHYPLNKMTYKTSDSILDFVEHGDLVEHDSGDIMRVTSISYYSDNTPKAFFHHRDSIEHIDVVALYKLQDNGDFKRYKV